MAGKGAYTKGYRSERRVIRDFGRCGYQCMRSAGSHGPFDIIAWNSSALVFIQVKAGGDLSPAELEILRAIPTPPHSRKLIIRFRDRVAMPDVTEV